MRRQIALAFSTFLMLAILTIPATPWVYQDGTPSDTKFEEFGPRADKLLIKLYPNETAEWDALARGEIDVTDGTLSKTYYDLFTSNAINPATESPYNETLNVVSYGDERDLFILDLNNNNNLYLGNPPNPAHPNPVYPNPTSVPEMRQAIAYLTDRSQLDTIIGTGFYVPLYTLVPPSMGAYSHPEIRPGGALENLIYPYNRTAAEAKLNAGGFPIGADGWRYWDRNANSVKDADEDLALKFVIRNDTAHRRDMGDFIAAELEAVKVKVNKIYATSSEAKIQVMHSKDFHLYTGAWGLSDDPDHLILWNWDYYWHPASCYNYAGVNNALFNEYSYGVLFANTFEEAKKNAWLAQEDFAAYAKSIPLWSYAGNMAMSRFYTGGNTWQPVSPDDGENAYRGEYWEGAVSMPSYGIDNLWSFLNMHPTDHERGDGENMTIRWGFKTASLKSFNPIFAEWQWDWDVLSLIYESLLMRNPYDRSKFIPRLAEKFETGTYNHPVYGTCTKIRFTMRSDATWHDGTPITLADVYFSLKELPDILRARGIPPTWSKGISPWPGAQSILAFKMFDAYNFDVLLDVKAVFATAQVGSIIILPKHIWKPLAETAPISVLTGFAPDPNMIGSGPWRFLEYVEGSNVTLVSNKPDRSVQTSHVGSTPVTSPKGYWRYTPLTLEWKIDGSNLCKVEYGQTHTVNFTLSNLFYGGPITIDVYTKVTHPNGTISESTETDLSLNANGQSESNWTWSYTDIMKCKVKFDANVLVKSPTALSGWHNTTKLIWATKPATLLPPIYPPPWPPRIFSDIVGSTFYDDIGWSSYPYKYQLPTPDFKVDIKDIAYVAKAFGTYPGHGRWIIVGDNCDSKIDIKDIATIATAFGWGGTP